MSHLMKRFMPLAARSSSLFKLPHRSYVTIPVCAPVVKPRIARGLVVGMYEKEVAVYKPRLSKGGVAYDDKNTGRLMELVESSDLSGRLGEQATFTNMGPDIGCVTVVGLGAENAGYCERERLDVNRENVRVAVSIGVNRLERQNCTHIVVDAMDHAEEAAEAAALSLFKYQDNVMEANRRATAEVDVYDDCDADGWALGLIKADAQNLARRLCESPANQMTPMLFAQAAVEALCPLGVNVEVRNLDWIEANGFAAFMAVARSSCEPPVMLELTYCKGMSDEKPIMLLGQGLTFNSGGIDLKKPLGMQEYRASMAGAALVVAAVQAVASMGLSLKINALIPLCENMTSGMAVRPGDVINVRPGKSLVVHDTNEVGVLMMLDALLYGQKLYQPNLIVNVGTFTDEIEAALAGSAAGVFTPSAHIWDELTKASALTGDRIWKMPTWDYYSRLVKDYEKYDTSNKGHAGYRGLVCKSAALFREYNECDEWMHMDVRATGMQSKTMNYPYTEMAVMAGSPTRTLIQYLAQHSAEAMQKQ